MDFTSDFQPYQPGAHLTGHGAFMDFTSEFSGGQGGVKRRRRTTTCSSSSRSRRSSLMRSPGSGLRRLGLLAISTFVVAFLALCVLPSSRLVEKIAGGRLGLGSGRSQEYPFLDIVSQSSLVSSPPSVISPSSSDDNAGLAEATKCLSLAKEMRRLGKLEKAEKLYSHALALAPRNPKILLDYGDFLKEHTEDLVKADHLFARALAFCPSDNMELRSMAIEKRKETSNRVQSLDDLVIERIEKKKKILLEIPSESGALKRAKKEAYFQYIYHTVGIEGNTMTLAQTRSILETKLAIGGKSIMEHNEILGMDAALKFINNTLVDKYGDITREDILEIHKRVLGNVDPGEAGLFRTTQVWVGDHVPPPPTLLSGLVDKFILWLNNEAQDQSLHPVRLAALAHYKLVYIHPFLDGNGRTSRLLMNLVLMKAGYPPVIIRRSDRDTYYRHLTTANEGDVRPFVRFIAHCTEKTLDAYLWASQEWPNNAGEIDTGYELEAHLPANLLENSMDQVSMQVQKQMALRENLWLDFGGVDNKVITPLMETDI